MSGFDGLADLAMDLLTEWICAGDPWDWRASFVPPEDGGSVGSPVEASGMPRPVGTRVASFDLTTDVPVSSQDSDAGTGYVGGYAPRIPVHVALRRGPEVARTMWTRFGIELQEQDIAAFVLKREVTPARGDLLIAPDGARYVVDSETYVYGVGSITTCYACKLQRRDPSDPVYTV